MFKVLFMLGVVPAQQNSLLWDRLVKMNPICMKTCMYSKEEDSSIFTMNGTDLIFDVSSGA